MGNSSVVLSSSIRPTSSSSVEPPSSSSALVFSGDTVALNAATIWIWSAEGVMLVDTVLFKVQALPMHKYSIELSDSQGHDASDTGLTAVVCMEILDGDLIAQGNGCISDSHANPIKYLSKTSIFYIRVRTTTAEGKGRFKISGQAQAYPYRDPLLLPKPTLVTSTDAFITDSLSPESPARLYAIDLPAWTHVTFQWWDYDNSDLSGDIQVSLLDSSFMVFDGPSNVNPPGGRAFYAEQQRSYVLVEPGPHNRLGRFQYRFKAPW